MGKKSGGECPQAAPQEPPPQSAFYAEFDSTGRLKQPEDSGNFRVKKGAVILLRVYEGSQPLPVSGCFVRNPLGDGETLEGNKDSLGHATFVFRAKIPGPYRLHLVYELEAASETASTTASSPSERIAERESLQSAAAEDTGCSYSYIIVEPLLRINNQEVNPDAVSVQTVLSRSLGGVKQWWRMFQHTKDMGYNMVHFTPLQTTGESGSCYSLANQLEVDPFFLSELQGEEAPKTPEEGLEILHSAVEMIERDLGILSATDLVLNHTANNSPWLTDHPEAGYTLENSPHLCAAFALDQRLQAFSRGLCDGVYRERFGCTATISTEDDLRRVMHALNEEVIKPFHFEQWFCLDVEMLMETWRAYLCSPSPKPRQDPRQPLLDTPEKRKERLFQLALAETGKCRGRPVSLKGSALFDVYPSLHFAGEFETSLKDIKGLLLETADISRARSLQSIEGLIRYDRLECRKGDVGRQHWNALTPRYFTILRSKDFADGKGPSADSTEELEAAAAAAAAAHDVAAAAKENHVIALANNGWVMGWDASKDFAAPGALVYLQRQLVVWSDCVKLRFGASRADSVFLWDMMSQYCRNIAKAFHAVRLDNCHSTPLHVAEYMLRECRREREDIWVFAELFTGSRSMDSVFEKHLGLNALIREAMQTTRAEDLLWQLQQFCGEEAVGQLDSRSAYMQLPTTASAAAIASKGFDAAAADSIASLPPGLTHLQLKPLKSSLCPALFYDCTHDNEPPAAKFAAAAALPHAALAAAAACASGSTRGTDELVPCTLSVVLERRKYKDYHPETPLRNPTARDAAPVAAAAGNQHKNATPAAEAPTQVEVCWRRGGGVVVIRGEWDGWSHDVVLEKGQADGVFRCMLNSEKHFRKLQGSSYVKTDKVRFKYIVDNSWVVDEALPVEADGQGHLNNVLTLPGAAAASHWGGDCGLLGVRPVLNALHVRLSREGFTQFFASIEGDNLIVAQRTNPHSLKCCYVIARCVYSWNQPSPPLPDLRLSGRVVEASLVACLRVDQKAKEEFREDPLFISGLKGYTEIYSSLDAVCHSSFSTETGQTTLSFSQFPCGSVAVVFTEPGDAEPLQRLQQQLRETIEATPRLLAAAPAADLNLLLFRCNQEERDASQGIRGAYDIPGDGELTYCGLAGPVIAFDRLRKMPGLQQVYQPTFKNLVSGTWLLSYTIERLSDTPSLEQLRELMVRTHQLLLQLKGVDWIRPYIADRLLSGVYAQVVAVLLSRLPIQAAAAASPTALDPLLLHLLTATLQCYGRVPSAPLLWGSNDPSLCAGLPHFSTGFMRNWGRDTFIAINGNLIATGRFAEARAEILAYARVLRHGLIPNLLDAGNNPRYNARDATWFFLQAVQDYCHRSPEGLGFLSTEVSTKYGAHASQLPDQPIKTVADIMHHILASHARGISFREWNAGRQLDEQMRDEGFNIEIQMEPTTGFIYGGNAFNCGTWMDKNGSSEKAGNKGIPATPRDGAAVEIIGLLKSALRFTSRLPEEIYPHKSVILADGSECTYSRWESLIEARFEKVFYIPLNPEEDADYFVNPRLINRRGIYKDTHRATAPWADYQLRPNACIAMAVAPELFQQEHARSYLSAVEAFLYGPSQLGLKTLDPSDLNYRPDYDNSNDGDDKSVAHGWNYHQGPEWVWPLGYFLEAKRLFYDKSASLSKGATCSKDSGVSAAAKRDILKLLKQHREYILTDPWRSLPELTNHGGRYCQDSCQAQAWSVGTVFSALLTLATTASRGESK